MFFADDPAVMECNKYPRWEMLAAVGLPLEEDSTETEGDIELVRRLLQCPDSEIFVNYANQIEATPLTYAASRGHIAIVEEILKHPEVDINRAAMDEGFTALIVASGNGNSEIVKLLLKRNETDVNLARKDNGISPLQIASMKGNVDVVELLISHPKIEVNHVSWDPHATALMSAIGGGNSGKRFILVGSFSRKVKKYVWSKNVTPKLLDYAKCRIYHDT